MQVLVKISIKQQIFFTILHLQKGNLKFFEFNFKIDQKRIE